MSVWPHGFSLHFPLLRLHYPSEICSDDRLLNIARFPVMITTSAMASEVMAFRQVEKLLVVRALAYKCPALRTFDYHGGMLARSESSDARHAQTVALQERPGRGSCPNLI